MHHKFSQTAWVTDLSSILSICVHYLKESRARPKRTRHHACSTPRDKSASPAERPSIRPIHSWLNESAWLIESLNNFRKLDLTQGIFAFNLRNLLLTWAVATSGSWREETLWDLTNNLTRYWQQHCCCKEILFRIVTIKRPIQSLQLHLH